MVLQGWKKKIESLYQHDSMPEANLLSTALSAHTLPVAQCPTPPCWGPLKPLEQGFTVCWLQTAPSSWKNWKPAWVPPPRAPPSSAASVRPDWLSARRAVPMGSSDAIQTGSSMELGLSDGWCYTVIAAIWGQEPSRRSPERHGNTLWFLKQNWNVFHFRSKCMPCSIGRVGEAKIEY